MQRKKQFYEKFIGTRQGHITIVRILRTEHKKGKIWECKCDCGITFEATTSQVSSGKITQCPKCGRFKNKESSVKQLTTHGHSKEKLYKIWHSMISRCTYPGDTNYKFYGCRGIRVCQEWQEDYMSFREWALNNGYNEGLTIDRIDVNGNYEPGNCRWITFKQQCRNRRSTQMITALGKTQCLTDWARDLKISNSALIQARNKGKDLTEYIEKKHKSLFMEG